MTEERSRSAFRSVGLATTAVVSLGAAATVGWAAAAPVGGSHPKARPPDDGAALRTAAQLQSARARLEQVRRDVALMLTSEDDLPRAKLADLTANVASLPAVQLPAASARQAVSSAPAPATHTTTGASGVHP